MVCSERRVWVRFTNSNRLFFIQLYHWFPSVLEAIMIIPPKTIVAGTVLVFAGIGAANPDPLAVGRRSMQICLPYSGA